MEDIETLTVELDGESFENPAYVSHKRGRNWAAVLTGKNAAQMQRSFLPCAGATVDIDGIPAGAALEIGGDYITSGGNRHYDRRYWRIVEVRDDSMTVEVYPTAARLLRAVRQTVAEATPIAA